MKAYKEYMDKITVSDALHKKIVSCALHRESASRAAKGKPFHRINIARRYTAALVCLAVVIPGVAAASYLLSRPDRWNVTPAPGTDSSISQPGSAVSHSDSSVSQPGPSVTPPGSSGFQPGSSVADASQSVTQPGSAVSHSDPAALQPGKDTPTSDASHTYTLYFNKADFQTAAKTVIPGHFWQELNDKELKAIFPGLAGTYSITATANFRSDKGEASLFNIDAHIVSAAGHMTYIQLAPGEVFIDYKIDVRAKSSDVLGTAVTAGYFETRPNSKGQRNVLYFASFKLSGITYYVELGGAEKEKEALEDEISKLIGLLIDGGPADLDIFDPVVPELREERLNLDEGRLDADFGAYLPAAVPEGFIFEDALRFINQERNELIVHWSKGLGYIDWRVSYMGDGDRTRITSIADRENYDLSLYPVPRTESVPGHLREIVDNPVFPIDELTLDTVRARTYEVPDSGDEPGPRMRFSVLYGNVLVELSVKGAAPETVFDILLQIGK